MDSLKIFALKQDLKIAPFWQRFYLLYAKEVGRLLYQNFKIREEVQVGFFATIENESSADQCCCLLQMLPSGERGVLRGGKLFCNHVIALAYGGGQNSTSSSNRDLSRHDRVMIKNFFKKLIKVHNKLFLEQELRMSIELMEKDLYMMESLHLPKNPLALHFSFLGANFELIFPRELFCGPFLVK